VNHRLVVAALLAALLPEAALAQVYVIPRRALRSPVHTYEFEWRHLDILVGPEAEGVAAPPAHRAHTQPPGTPGGPTPNQPQMRAPGASNSDTKTAPSSAVAQGEPVRPGEEGIGGSSMESIEPGSPTPVVDNKPDGGTAVSEPTATGSDLYVPIALATDGGTPDGGPAYATSLGVKAGGVRFFL
jgi:hypothetical protein